MCLNFSSKFVFGNGNTNRCITFSGQFPGTYLYECPPAKFMSNKDFECYDKSYKDKYVIIKNGFLIVG